MNSDTSIDGEEAEDYTFGDYRNASRLYKRLEDDDSDGVEDFDEEADRVFENNADLELDREDDDFEDKTKKPVVWEKDNHDDGARTYKDFGDDAEEDVAETSLEDNEGLAAIGLIDDDMVDGDQIDEELEDGNDIDSKN